MNQQIEEFFLLKKMQNDEKKQLKLIDCNLFSVGKAENPEVFYDEKISGGLSYDEWVEKKYSYNTVTCEYHKRIPFEVTDE